LNIEYESINIGSGGDGPAIRLNKEVFKGRTNSCETFDSPILLYDGQKHIRDSFNAKNFELFAL